MTTTIIILLILLGLFLFIVEFFIIPGISIAGIGGLISTSIGVYQAYIEYGSVGGTIILLSTLIICTLIVVLTLRSKTWKKMILTSTIKSTVEDKEELGIKVGDEAVAVTRLNPVGKAMVNDIITEAQCPGQFLDPHTKLIVTKVLKTHIIVKPQNK